MLLGIIHQGQPHPCNKTARNANLVQTITRDLSPDGRLRVTAKIINELRTDQTGKKGDSMDLPSGSRTLHVSIGKPVAKQQFSTEAMLRLKAQMNLSQQQTKTFAAALRTQFGRGSVAPGLMKELGQVKYKLSDFLRIKYVDMTKEKQGKETTILTHPLLYCDDVEAMILYICQERGWDPDDIMITVGIDDGQGSLKVSIILLFERIPAISNSF